MATGMAGKSPKAININPKTGEKYKLTMKELVAKQAAGDSLNKVQTERLKAAGKLAPPPSAATAKQKKLPFTIKQLMQKQAAGIPLTAKQLGRLQRSGKIAPSTNTPLQQLGGKQLQQAVGSQAGAGVGQFMNIIGQQGAFQPGSFKEQMDAAYQNVMNQYEQTMAPEFQREQANFQQMAAERGLDPNSEAYKTLQTQLNQRQDQARQGAMQNALQASQGVQAQGFGQALQGYQAPAGMLQAFQPYYQQAGTFQGNLMERNLALQKLAQDKAISDAQLANNLRLGELQAKGQLTYNEQMELEKLRNAGAMAVQALRNEGQLAGMPSTGASIASGIASGVGAGVGTWLGNQ